MPASDITRVVVVTRDGAAGLLARFRVLFSRTFSPLFGVLLKKDVQDMDPVTAVFNFLSTPEGQKLIDPLVKLETDFVAIIADLIKSVHAKLATPTAPLK